MRLEGVIALGYVRVMWRLCRAGVWGLEGVTLFHLDVSSFGSRGYMDHSRNNGETNRNIENQMGTVIIQWTM